MPQIFWGIFAFERTRLSNAQSPLIRYIFASFLAVLLVGQCVSSGTVFRFHRFSELGPPAHFTQRVGLGERVSTASAMGSLFSRPEPVEDPHAEALRLDKHLLREIYPRSDGLKFKLSSGRTLGYVILGAINAPPERTIVFFHGTPGTRFFFHNAHAKEAERVNVRIIIPERPGFGLSTPHPERTLLSFADDVAELLGNLELNQVVSMGYSAGGPYALALAKRWPLSVSKVAVVSSLSPVWLDKVDKVTKGMSRMSWWGYFIARRIPRLLPILTRLMSRAAVRDAFEPHRDDFTADENEIFRNDRGIRYLFAASTMELYSRPSGATAEAEDYKLFAKAWDFELADMPENIPVFAYAGEDDDKTVRWTNSEEVATDVFSGKIANPRSVLCLLSHTPV